MELMTISMLCMYLMCACQYSVELVKIAMASGIWYIHNKKILITLIWVFSNTILNDDVPPVKGWGLEYIHR